MAPATLPIAPSSSLEQDILVEIEEQAVMTLDALIDHMPQYSWSQIFQAVDTLARGGRISLRRHGFDYSLFSIHYAA